MAEGNWKEILRKQEKDGLGTHNMCGKKKSKTERKKRGLQAPSNTKKIAARNLQVESTRD